MATYQHRAGPAEATAQACPSARSLRGLDGINILMADMRDGVAAGVFGVVSVLIASDLMRGTGRFNFAQGLMALSAGIGAALSNATAGCVVQWFGCTAGFLCLAAIVGCGFAFLMALMPETRDPGGTLASGPALP